MWPPSCAWGNPRPRESKLKTGKSPGSARDRLPSLSCSWGGGGAWPKLPLQLAIPRSGMVQNSAAIGVVAASLGSIAGSPPDQFAAKLQALNQAASPHCWSHLQPTWGFLWATCHAEHKCPFCLDHPDSASVDWHKGAAPSLPSGHQLSQPAVLLQAAALGLHWSLTLSRDSL